MSTAFHGLFSEAFNASSLTSGVSPQTGAFQACLTMAEITVGIQQPTAFTLKLSIGMSSTIKVTSDDNVVNFPVAGTYIKRPLSCASFNIPYISTLDSKWYTASGAVESISAHNDGREIELVYHKVKDVLIESLSSSSTPGPGSIDGVWVVKYKDGTVEYYTRHRHVSGKLDQRHGFLYKLVSSAGHILEFRYDKFWRVIKIFDIADSNNYIAIDYGDPLGDGAGMTYTVTQATYGQTFVSKIQLVEYKRKASGFTPFIYNSYYMVSSVTLPNMTNNKCYFSYNLLGTPNIMGAIDPAELGWVLDEVVTPYGLKQKAAYTTLDYGYVDSVLKKVPVVRALFVTDIGSGGAALGSSKYAISYQFKTIENLNNYTGYTPNTAATPGKDACIYKTDNYEYSTTEVHGASDVDMGDESGVFDRKIIRTYNRFHSLVKERTLYRDEGSLNEVVRTYTYPVVAGDITSQSEKFQSWNTCTTEYVMDSPDSERESEAIRMQTQQFDEFGNLLATTAESGISQAFEYYGAAGDTDCPAALNGIKCYVKRIDTIPKPTEPAPVPALSNKRQEFTYKKVVGLPYTITLFGSVIVTAEPYMVLSAVEKVKTAAGMLTLTSSSYQEANTPRILIGAPLLIDTTSPGVTQGVSPVDIKNSIVFAWTIIYKNNDISQPVNVKKSTTNRATVGGSAVPSIEGGSVESRLADGLIVTETSANSVETTYEYNQFAQLTRKTYFSNRPEYTEVEEFAFEFPKKYQAFGLKNLVTYKKVRSNGANDTSIYFRYYLGANLQVCDISQGKFAESQSPSDIDPNDTEYRIAKRNMYRSDGSLIGESLFDHCQTSASGGASEGINTFTYMDKTSNVSSAISPIDVKYVESIDPQKYIIYRGIVGAPICYLQEINDYGSVNVVRVTKFGVDKADPEVLGYKLLVNTYDGFGQLTSAGNISMGFVGYVYDELGRVTEEGEVDGNKAPVQTITYEYSTHIPSMALPVRLKCTVDDGSVLMDAKREYDAFSRLTKQTTPNVPPLTVLTERYEYTDQNFPYLPTKLTKDIGFVSFLYDSCTGMLLKKTLNNGSSGGQPAGLIVDFLYDKKTKLLQRSTIGLTSEAYQSRYDYTYDRFDRVSKMTASFEGDVSSYVTTYKFSGLLGLPESWGIYAGTGSITFPYWECEYWYDSVGRVSKIVYSPYDDGALLATINVVIKYVDSTQGYASGNIESIELSVPAFNSSVGLALKKIKVDFRYDERGLEVQRSYSILGDDDNPLSEVNIRFDVSNVINENHLVRSQTTVKPHVSGVAGEYSAASKEYSYNNSGGGGLGVSTSIQYDDGTTPSTRATVTQFANGNSKIYQLNTSIDNVSSIQRYTYIADRVSRIAPPQGEVGEAAVYEYDNNGNVTKDPGLNFLRYNVENALSTFVHSGSTAPLPETKYYYSPSGELNRIKDTNGESVYYFYNNNTLAGEVSQRLRTFYIQVGNILLGRVLVYPPPSTSASASCELEIFGTDSAGSVRAVYRFAAGATAPVVNYYDYSDYGSFQ